MRQNMIEALADARTSVGFFERDAKSIEAVGEALKNDGTIKPSELAEFYFYLRELHEQADAAVKKLYHVHDMLNKHLIPSRLKDAGLDAIRVPSIARSFSIVTKTSASFIDKDAGLEWLRGLGAGEMIQETVNAQTLSSFCRNMILEKGIDPPQDIVKVTSYDTMSMVKYKPKGGEA